jgi:transcriptional regulator with XRE-family HTH domain
MNINKQTTPQAALKELTARLARFRMENGITQAQLAMQAGVSKRTVERIEKGYDLQLTTLVRLLRVLGLTDRLDLLIPEKTISPMDMLAGKPKPAKRARRKKTAQKHKSWKWGDEQ